MLIYDEDYQILDIICDLCGEIDTYDGKWHECIKDAKTDGWVLYNIGSEREWEHYCINCSKVEI
jgi:hypothetical protein